MSLVGDWRRLYGIKQEALAREAGIHVISLSRIENGTEPSVTNALKICGALSRLSGRGIGVEHVFYDSADAEFFAWEALGKAEDEVHAAEEQH